MVIKMVVVVVWYALNECAEGVGGSVGIIKCEGNGILLIHPISF